jgi:TolB-like protein
LHVLALYIVGAWAVLQVASLTFPGWHIPDSAIRYIWFGAFWLFPVAVVFGWRYELTSGGIRRTIKSDGNIAHVPLSSADSWSVSVLALLSLAIVFGTVIEVLGMREPLDDIVAADEVPQNSIAVLPFVNMSDDDGNEYFSDGISEQLLNELARVPGLHVAARTSAFYYKGKDELIQKMGEQLGVRTLLEGSVRKYGNKVRITAQLINAGDGYHLWSETYDRELDDIFAVQDDIARAIAATLKVEFLMQDGQPPEQAATNNLPAWSGDPQQRGY